MTNLESLRNFLRGRVHGGYLWAMVAVDGELICETCAHENVREILHATKYPSRGYNTDWACVGVTHSGEHEGPAAHCAHCNREIFESTEE